MMSSIARQLGLVLAAASLLTALPACRSEKQAGCSSNSSCPDGHICISQQCEQLCDDDGDCARGSICDLGKGLCEEGKRPTPELTQVRGNGSSDCTAATGQPCINSGFFVTGSNLTGAVFTLSGPAASPTVYAMTVVPGTASDTQVEVIPVLAGAQLDISEGEYVLAAANASGQAQTTVQLLRGEAGPDADGTELINRINAAGTVGKISEARLDVTGGSGGGGGTLYVYSGSTTATESAVEGDRMIVRVNGSADNSAVSLAVDQTRLVSLCGDADGCSLTLGATRFVDVSQSNYLIEAPLHGGSCKFYLDASGSWSLSQPCVARFGLYKYDTGQAKEVFDRPYQMYEYSNVYGKDGSNSDATDEDGGALIVMGFKGTCYLAEAAHDSTSNTGAFLADNVAGLTLIASGPAWDTATIYASGNAAQWPASDANRACILLVED